MRKEKKEAKSALFELVQMKPLFKIDCCFCLHKDSIGDKDNGAIILLLVFLNKSPVYIAPVGQPSVGLPSWRRGTREGQSTWAPGLPGESRRVAVTHLA